MLPLHALRRRWRRRRFAGAERGSRVSQSSFNLQCGRVRASEHAPRDPFRVLERRHALAEIVECGAIVREDRLGGGLEDLNRSVWRRMCETGDRLVASEERYGPLREFWRGYDAPVVEAPPVVEAAPAPRSGGSVISPQLFRRYGYFDGEFPLPVRSLE